MSLEHDHNPEAIAARLAGDRSVNYLRDWIYGGIDGAVTTFAIVAGAVGASLSSRVVVILGLANLIADGFSMAASNYAGTKSEVDDLRRVVDIERRHIEIVPEGEREEVRQILASKGLSGETLDSATRAITADKKTWIDLMVTEEYGLATTLRSPLLAGFYTFAAFVLAGTVPLIPYLLSIPSAFAMSLGLVGVVFFSIGSLKSLWSIDPWWRSGLETLVIGMTAAGIAYVIGYLLRGLAD